jgi:hypothetical protein
MKIIEKIYNEDFKNFLELDDMDSSKLREAINNPNFTSLKIEVDKHDISHLSVFIEREETTDERKRREKIK